ncbi:MAG: hypothetical protein RL189_659 [Pseudomonadota bacterium]
MLYTKCKTDVELLLNQRNIHISQLMSLARLCDDSLLDALLSLATEHYKQNVTYGLEAAYLFQPADFNEKGWPMTTARNLQQLFDCIEELYPARGLRCESRQNEFICSWIPPPHTPAFVLHFIAAVSLINIRGQGIPNSEILKVILPEWCAPNLAQKLTVWQEHFYNSFKVTSIFLGSAFEIHLTAKALSIEFENADEIIFKFFQSRCRYSIHPNIEKYTDQNFNLLLSKIKKIMLSHLDESEHSFADVAHSLGLSIRSLERTLARHNHSLRKIKQELQCSTATELLRTGMRPKEVAGKIGFSDPTAFSRAFLKWTGEPPSSFRERMCDAQC